MSGGMWWGGGVNGWWTILEGKMIVACFGG